MGRGRAWRRFATELVPRRRTTPSVLFFDEFDAVAKERGDHHETGEIKRVVTSLLMQVDELPSYTVTVAATNHPELLDRAVWHRFQLRLSLDAPSERDLAGYLERFVRSLGGGLGHAPARLAARLGPVSYAEAEEFCLDVKETVRSGDRSRQPEENGDDDAGAVGGARADRRRLAENRTLTARRNGLLTSRDRPVASARISPAPRARFREAAQPSAAETASELTVQPLRQPAMPRYDSLTERGLPRAQSVVSVSVSLLTPVGIHLKFVLGLSNEVGPPIPAKTGANYVRHREARVEGDGRSRHSP